MPKLNKKAKGNDEALKKKNSDKNNIKKSSPAITKTSTDYIMAVGLEKPVQKEKNTKFEITTLHFLSFNFSNNFKLP